MIGAPSTIGWTPVMAPSKASKTVRSIPELSVLRQACLVRLLLFLRLAPLFLLAFMEGCDAPSATSPGALGRLSAAQAGGAREGAAGALPFSLPEKKLETQGG